jgi:hypothetical protein
LPPNTAALFSPSRSLYGRTKSRSGAFIAANHAPPNREEPIEKPRGQPIAGSEVLSHIAAGSQYLPSVFRPFHKFWNLEKLSVV